MFNKLILKNFQSIADADVPLSRVTVVAGPSNLGKSALCRSVKTLMRNSFDASYMRIGEKEMCIGLEDSEDGKLSYERKTSPKYVLDGQVFEKMGKTVPSAVQGWLRCSPADIEGLSLDLNIQSQFDPPFLLTQTGPDLARILGRLLDIDSVLEAQKKLVRDRKTKEKENDSLEMQIEDSARWIHDNAFLEDVHAALEEAQRIDAETDALQKKADSLDSLLADIKAVSGDIQPLKEQAKLFAGFPEDFPEDLKKEQCIQEAVSVQSEVRLIQNKLSEIFSILPLYEKLLQLKSLLKDAIDTREYIRILQRSIAFLSEQEAVFSKFLLVKDKLKELSDEVKERRTVTAEISSADASLESMKQEMLASGMICPVSNRPMQEVCFQNG